MTLPKSSSNKNKNSTRRINSKVKKPVLKFAFYVVIGFDFEGSLMKFIIGVDSIGPGDVFAAEDYHLRVLRFIIV